MADDEFNGGIVGNYGQQQYFVRNSNIDSWSNYVWNQVFMGDNGAPATSFGSGVGQYTTLATTPVSEEEPFLYTDDSGAMRVFVPGLRRNSVGPSYAEGHAGGLFAADLASSSSRARARRSRRSTRALARGLNLILTPGVYDLPQAIRVRPPEHDRARPRLRHADPAERQRGDADSRRSRDQALGHDLRRRPAELAGAAAARSRRRRARAGRRRHLRTPNDPTLVQDVFFRIGGAEAGKATTALVVDDSHAILDDIWAWRADHGNGVGWTANTADTG